MRPIDSLRERAALREREARTARLVDAQGEPVLAGGEAGRQRDRQRVVELLPGLPLREHALVERRVNLCDPLAGAVEHMDKHKRPARLIGPEIVTVGLDQMKFTDRATLEPRDGVSWGDPEQYGCYYYLD